MKQSPKILIFRLSSIGDIILTTALVRCVKLKYPNATIDYVVKRQFAPILEMVPYVSNVIPFDSSGGFKSLRDLRKNLAKKKYDVVLDIHKNWRSLLIRNFIGAKKVFTFKKHVLKRYIMVKHKIDAYHIVRPVFMRFVDAAEKIGVEYDNKKTELTVPDEAQKFADNYLEDNYIKPHKNIIVICPGASFKNKEWQTEKFVDIAQKIISDLQMQVVLLGGSKEKEICNTIAKQVQGPILSVAGVFTLPQSGALINRAQIVIAGDTGMLHMAEALRVPVVGIYGPTVKQFGYFPILEKSRVAQVELYCRPCTKMGMNTCPLGTYECTEKITVNQVYTLLKEVIQAKKL